MTSQSASFFNIIMDSVKYFTVSDMIKFLQHVPFDDVMKQFADKPDRSLRITARY